MTESKQETGRCCAEYTPTRREHPHCQQLLRLAAAPGMPTAGFAAIKNTQKTWLGAQAPPHNTCDHTRDHVMPCLSTSQQSNIDVVIPWRTNVWRVLGFTHRRRCVLSIVWKTMPREVKPR